MAQLAEAGGLNPPEYGFESHWGHAQTCISQGEIHRGDSDRPDSGPYRALRYPRLCAKWTRKGPLASARNKAAQVQERRIGRTVGMGRNSSSRSAVRTRMSRCPKRDARS